MPFPGAIAFLGLLAADPFVGAWKLDPARSTGTIPKAETVEIHKQGKMLSVTVTIVLPDASSSTLRIRYRAPATGGQGRVEEGPYNGVMLKRVDPKSMDTTYLVDGKEIRSTTAVVSPDRKSMTSSGKTLGAGEHIEWTMFFEKQK
jgi:hypothetical protein